MLTACMLGRCFAVATFAPALGPWHREIVKYHGLAARCSGNHCLDNAFAAVAQLERMACEVAGAAP